MLAMPAVRLSERFRLFDSKGATNVVQLVFVSSTTECRSPRKPFVCKPY